MLPHTFRSQIETILQAYEDRTLSPNDAKQRYKIKTRKSHDKEKEPKKVWLDEDEYDRIEGPVEESISQ